MRACYILCSYSFAVVGINITAVAHKLLRSGLLRSHFYNREQAIPNLAAFHDVYGNSSFAPSVALW